MPIRPERARKLHETPGPEAADQMVEWMRGSRGIAGRRPWVGAVGALAMLTGALG